MEDNKLDLLKQKIEEMKKERNFFWDTVILSVALFISGLSISSIVAELFSNENSVACPIKLDNRNVFTFVNSYCHKDLPKVKYFSLVAFSQAALLVAPHYFWQVVFSSRFESFMSHAAKVKILRESNTGKYPHHNYTIVKYLRREFHTSHIILGLYIVKLVTQLVIVFGCFVVNGIMFENITNMDINFECKDDNQVFDNLLLDNQSFEGNDDNQVFDNQSFGDALTCVYPRKYIINSLVWIDYILIFIALIMLLIGLFWWAFCNHSQKDNETIANVCYNLSIDPRYYYNQHKKGNSTRFFEMKNDFTFLIASLNSGIKRVFNTVLIEIFISQKANEPSQKEPSWKKSLQELDKVVVDDTQPKASWPGRVPISLSELISELCKGIIKETNFDEENTSELVALDISSSFHSYVYDISKSYKKKVVSVILGYHHESKTDIIEISEHNIKLRSMKSSLNTPEVIKDKSIGELSGIIENELSLIVVGPLDSQHEQSIVSQIVEKYSEMPGSRFKNNAVMLIIKPIEMDKNKMSNDFSEYNPGISCWKEKELKNFNVIQKGIAEQWIERLSFSTYEVTIYYRGSECNFQLKSYFFDEQQANTKASSATNAVAAGDKNDQVPADRHLESGPPTSGKVKMQKLDDGLANDKNFVMPAKDRLSKIWSQNPCHNCIAVINSFKIHHGSLHTLKCHEYLNDEIINGYLALLTTNDPNIFVINSYVVTAIITKKITEMRKNLFSKHKMNLMKLIIGMYNKDRNHWVLVAIDLKNDTFLYLDPFGYSDSAMEAHQQFRNYFNMRNEILSDQISLEGFKIRQCSTKIQFDAHNCGVITLKLAEQLITGSEERNINEDVFNDINYQKLRLDIGVALLEGSVDMKDACVLCGQFEGSDNEHENHWVQCGKCPNWHHLKCLDLKPDDYEINLQIKKPFFCLACDAKDHCFE